MAYALLSTKLQRKTTLYLANLLRSYADKKSNVSGKALHARILRAALFPNTYLSNRLLDFYIQCEDIKCARNVFNEMPVKDIYSWNAMLGLHCKAGNLPEVYQVFDEMRERNVVSWNNVISALVRGGLEEKALDVYGMMILEGYLPTRFTLASVLSACSKLLDAYFGMRCHGLGVKIGLDKNVFVGNALLNMYSKCGLITDAVRVFEDLPEPNEVSFTSMICGLVREGQVLKAFRMFKLMFDRGVQVDSVCLSSILGVCARRDNGECVFYDDQGGEGLDNVHGKLIHGLLYKLGFTRDLHLNNSLLDMYAKNEDMDSIELVFAEMPELNVVSWNVMIAGYGRRHESDKSLEYFERMKLHGFEPNQIAYVNVLGACARSRDIESGRKMFDSIPCPSISSWNAMLSGYSQSGNNGETIKLFRDMQYQSVKPDRTTLAIILSSCTEMAFLEGGRQVHTMTLKAILSNDKYVASGLIGLYSECGKIKVAECIFTRIPGPDIVCWNSMMSGFSISFLDEEAFVLFKQMRLNRTFPSESSYATILGCCAGLSSSFQGRQIHAQIVKDGYMNDVFVGSSLVNMYCKCGDVDAAVQFFSTMSSKNTVTWNEMIHGYAQNGRGNEAICMYRNMISSGEKPDGVTFVSVLTACSHSGLVDVGVEIFSSMQREHGIEPELDHFICVIDCLGRAGRFQEAEVLLENMPYKNSPIIWEVLLSCCRVHANVSLAKRAAAQLFCLDPRNSAPYVLLANMYTSLGQWDEARSIRALMNENRVLKNPGFSWSEDNNNRMLHIAMDHGLPGVDNEFELANG